MMRTLITRLTSRVKTPASGSGALAAWVLAAFLVGSPSIPLQLPETFANSYSGDGLLMLWIEGLRQGIEAPTETSRGPGAMVQSPVKPKLSAKRPSMVRTHTKTTAVALSTDCAITTRKAAADQLHKVALRYATSHPEMKAWLKERQNVKSLIEVDIADLMKDHFVDIATLRRKGRAALLSAPRLGESESKGDAPTPILER